MSEWFTREALSGRGARLLALALILSVTARSQSGEVVARAAGVTGAVTLTSPRSATLLLTPGYILSPGDRIDTRAGGRVVIDLSDGSMVVVAPGSVVTLKDFRAASSLRELFEITLGMVRVKINHFAGKPNPYRMNSPTASIAVRGTEFTIAVDNSGATDVTVIEGEVEVSSLSDPARSVTLEAGQSLRLVAAIFAPYLNRGGDRGDDRHGDAPPYNNLAQAHGFGSQPPPNAPKGVPGQAPPVQPKAPDPPQDDRGPDDASTRARTSIYDRYLAGLTDLGQAPFLLRFNAFAEDHLDSLENPAYASVFRSAEGQILFVPTIHGGQTLAETPSSFGPAATLPSDYSLSPQVSFFAPVRGFTVGGTANVSYLGNSLQAPSIGSAPGTFYSGSAVIARRFGSNSLGLELATLQGSGSLSSTTTDNLGPGPQVTERLAGTSGATQTRLTLGYAVDLSRSAKLGVYYRYGWIHASDRDTYHTIGGLPVGLDSTRSWGHSSELGGRIRGVLTPRLSYGLSGSWLGVSLLAGLVRTGAVDSHERDRVYRAMAGAGLGYLLSRRTVLTFDFAGGVAHNSSLRTEDSTLQLLQDSGARVRFVSVHAALQRDLTRRLFITASFLNVWRAGDVAISLFPDRFGYVSSISDSFFALSTTWSPGSHFSDFGAGWRFSPDLFAEYIYSTDYGVSSATHMLILRYTIRKGR